MKLTPEEIERLQDMCADDSDKIIQYLKEQKDQERPHDLFLLIVTVIGTISSIVAAVASIISLFQ